VSRAMSQSLTDAAAPVDWVIERGPIGYETACAAMAARVDAILAGSAPELVWLVEHPALYTAGTSAQPTELLDPARFPVYRSGRGGRFTYHGPGQRVGYVMLRVGTRYGDVRAYVTALEAWIIAALAALGLRAETIAGRVGVWVARGAPQPDGHDKIAAIGVRLRRWVSSHGFSINVAPDLSNYAGIVPCGIRDGGVTSLARLGLTDSFDVLDAALRHAFEARFGPTLTAELAVSAAARPARGSP
jgi:lipoyl(octanoyl) transferase